MLPQRILGIDPGLRNTGFGLIEVRGSEIRYLASGTIRSGQGSLPQRLHELFSGVQQLLRQYQPDRAAIEQVFVNVNPQSTLLLGQARGAALCALMTDPADSTQIGGLQIAEYTPALIKQSIAGSGRARKTEIQAMVVRLLNLPGTPSPDAADALACAICDAHHATLFALTGQAAASTAQPAGRRGRGSRDAWAKALKKPENK